MAINISDGKGTGSLAGVSHDNRLLTSSRTVEFIDQKSIDGTGFIVGTNIITLTSANESAIFYVKNDNPEMYLQMVSLSYNLGKSNSTGDVIIKAFANITGGTLLTDGYEIEPVNRNFGTFIPATGTFLQGSEGLTVTGGQIYNTKIYQDGVSDNLITGTILPNGSSYSVSIQPPAGNTSMKVTVFTRMVYFEILEI